MTNQNVFKYVCYSSSLKTILDVQKQMEELDRELQGTNLLNLIAFNHTYLVITNHVIDKLGKNYFQNDHEMQKIDITFGKYYFDALKTYVDGKKPVPAWDTFFRFCEEDTSYQWVYMAMGVNAHVNNDLAFALADVKNDTNNYDFLRINTLIAESLKEVVWFLKENSSVLNTTKNRGVLLYASTLNKIITRWRERAWKNYLKLRESSHYKTQIEKNAGSMARRLKKIKRL